MSAALPLTALEGLLAFVSPCILPMLPVYLAWLARGRATGRGAQLVRTLCFILGFTCVFVAMGATATALGGALSAHRALLTRVGGAFIALFGLSFILNVNVPLLSRTFRLSATPRAGGLLSAWLFGVVFSLGWTPCLGVYLGAALTMAASADTLWGGALMLLCFSLGLGVPYFAVALLAGRLKPLTDWLTRHQRVISIISGVILLALGIAMLTGVFGYYAALFDAL